MSEKIEIVPVHGSQAHPFRIEAAAEVNGVEPNPDYREIRIGYFDSEKNCVADILIGVNSKGEPRVLITTGADGESDHNVSVFPLRSLAEAVEVDAHA